MTAIARSSSTARESILASIHQSLVASASVDRVHARPQAQIAQAQLQDSFSVNREALLQNFKNNLESVGGHCHVVRDEGEAAQVVRITLENLSATRIAISDSPLVGSIATNLADIEIVKNADPEFLYGSDIGITGAQWAIAETGTLVLESDVERHRLTSLIPPVHLCILQAEKMRQTLGEILELVHRDLSRTITFITGASRTSDIELTLAIGVHGPRELHVIVIEEPRS